MPQFDVLLLVAVAILMFKHTVADFYLQTSYQYLHKGIYGHPGGLLHSAIHIGLTPLVYLMLAPTSWLVVAALLLVSLPYVDLLKEQLVRRYEWTAHDPGFWYALGTDQLVHGLTYLVIIAILVTSM
jgi:hypothetical protein